VVIVIVLLPVILTITLPNLNGIKITLQKIEYNGLIAKNNTAMLNIFFDITNPTSQALTTSQIDFKLFANGKSLGDHVIQYADIPLNGRPQILANGDSVIHQVINVPNLDKNLIADLNKNNQTIKNIRWKAEGSAIIESGFSSAPKNFTSSW
jgi:predicted extracellular nuclease